MRPFGLLLVGAAYATEESPTTRCWQANPNAPYCGCQIITADHNMINSTCTATFGKDVHMLSVASAFPIPELSNTEANTYAWTGYQGNSHENLHDILYFFERDECVDNTFDPPRYNLTIAGAEWEPTINCVANTDGNGDPAEIGGVRLGNFNYDIARSVQRYNVPIKNLGEGQTVTINVVAETDAGAKLASPFLGLELRNVSAHHGHGDATVVGDDCSNGGQFIYTQNAEHEGDLEYAQFELCATTCHPNDAGPNNDYCFEVPSPWATTVNE